MIKLLLKVFVKNNEMTEDPKVREKYGVLGGALGIICNLFLFALKLAIGTAMGSIAIVSDAFNNLSDTGSSIVSVIGTKLSNKKPDREHPFGHGRFEYISSLIASFIIMLVGFELLKTSAVKITEPEKITFNSLLTIILCVSVLIKVWMYSYNRFLGKRINSGVLIATAQDCINDVISTSAVIVTTIIGRFVDFPPLDGIIGSVVSVMIMYSGFQIARDTIGLLLGTPPEKELIESIREYITAGEGIVGMHDLIVHDYGPGRVFASVHAEVPDDYDIVKVHEIIDEIEHEVGFDLGIDLVIHMDPITVNCEKTDMLKKMTAEVVRSIDERMRIHDFRMTDGDNNINLIFDIEVPADVSDFETLKAKVHNELAKRDSRINTVIDIDIMYI